jgi:hypothetical protein
MSHLLRNSTIMSSTMLAFSIILTTGVQLAHASIVEDLGNGYGAGKRAANDDADSGSGPHNHCSEHHSMSYCAGFHAGYGLSWGDRQEAKP